MLKIIIKTGIRFFLLYALWLFVFKGLPYISETWKLLILGFYDAVLLNIVYSTRFVASLLTDLNITSLYDTLYIPGHDRFIITQECLAIKLIFFTIIPVLALPGSLWKNKLWFIPAAVLFVHLMNIFRMIGLTLTIVYTNYFDFMHGFVFRVLLYLGVIAIWYVWMKYFIDLKKIPGLSNLNNPGN